MIGLAILFPRPVQGRRGNKIVESILSKPQLDFL